MGRHRKPTRKAVHFARIAVGGLALAEITGGLPAVTAPHTYAATPTYSASPVLEAHVEKLNQHGGHHSHKHHGQHANKHHAVKAPVAPPVVVAPPAVAAPVVAAPAAVAADPDMGFLFDHYTVRDGDTLTHIAAAYDLPWAALYAANADQLEHPDALFVGQTLRLPA
jgi:hypothetical protein